MLGCLLDDVVFVSFCVFGFESRTVCLCVSAAVFVMSSDGWVNDTTPDDIRRWTVPRTRGR